MKYDGKAPLNSASANRKAQAVCRQLKEEGVPEWELRDAFKRIVEQDESLKELEYPDGNITEDWICVDCGTNTAPGLLDGATVLKRLKEADISPQYCGPDSEVYTVRDAIWEKAGMEPFGGCLCIGCLEKRLGRRLKPKDFDWNHPFNALPGTPRLLNRRKYWAVIDDESAP